MPYLSVDEKYGVANRSVIVHEKPDNLTKPDSKRIACGTIRQT